jgi:hypothetical protein
MKKSVLITVVTVACFSLSSFSQETNEASNQNITLKKNEIKLNAISLIAFKWFDVSYERLLNEESSVGIGVLTRIGSEDDESDIYRTFSLTPYYRHFFSKKYAEGFFIEGFAMLHSGKNDYYFLEDIIQQGETYTDLALGISAGAKFVTKRGFVAEFYLGIGRDLLDQSDLEVVGRGGISLGFRF